jgi:uncharacterized repeat protein (TIGR02543 family)
MHLKKNPAFLCLLLLLSFSETANVLANLSPMTDTSINAPIFSNRAGIYQLPVSLSLASVDNTDSIYYTTDGTEPVDTSTIYTSPIDISNNTVVRARVIRNRVTMGKTETNTYLIGRAYNLPVVALTTSPGNLWNIDTGIYVLGLHASAEAPHMGANYWQDWERPVHIELFETDTAKFYEVDAGMKIAGNWSRMFPVKTLSFTAKAKYGPKKFDCQFFPEKEIYKFNSFKARAAANDWLGDNINGTLIRDEVMADIVAPLDIEAQAYRQSVLFMNGEYFGIINLKEVIDEYYLENNKGANKDSVDILYGNAEAEVGSNLDYKEMISFLAGHDMSLPENYEYIKTQMDVDNFIKFAFTEIYFYNWDWPCNNIKFWRPASPHGKWRWIMYDMEVSFGMFKANPYTVNTLALALATNGPSWPNPPWSTFLFRSLMKNTEFRNSFINYAADIMNSAFLPQLVNQKINKLSVNLSGEIDYQAARWGNSKAIWQNEVNSLINFSNKRPDYMRSIIKANFGISSVQQVKVSVNNSSAGEVKINSIVLPAYPWSGIYFDKIPIDVTAIARPGYKFEGWSGSIETDKQHITLDMDGAQTLTANFVPDADNTIDNMVINEINFKSEPANDCGDWIELFNSGTQNMDISGWKLTDSDSTHSFIFPEGTIVGPREFLVITANSISFSEINPDLTNVTGNFNFGLSSTGETIKLYNEKNSLADSVTYGIFMPWPFSIGGTGYTIALINADKDNALGENWKASVIKLGTPGKPNDNLTSTGQTTNFAFIDFQAWPNPFTESVSISFTNDTRQNITITVYTAEGKLVDVILNEFVEEGTQRIAWDGRNNSNQPLQNGIYIIQLKTPDNIYFIKAIKTL